MEAEAGGTSHLDSHRQHAKLTGRRNISRPSHRARARRCVVYPPFQPPYDTYSSSGRGGDGCVAFHREKFKPYGPPSGGNGGRGADVYILPDPHLTTLSSVPTHVRGNAGGQGMGTWQHGRAGAPVILRVPLGTVVRELRRGDPRRPPDEWETEEEACAELDRDERRQRWR